MTLIQEEFCWDCNRSQPHQNSVCTACNSQFEFMRINFDRANPNDPMIRALMDKRSKEIDRALER